MPYHYERNDTVCDNIKQSTNTRSGYRHCNKITNEAVSPSRTESKLPVYHQYRVALSIHTIKIESYIVNNMSEIKIFFDRLDKILLPIVAEFPARLEITFNIILVKYGERPSTLIEYYVTSNKLAADDDFMCFIREDSL